MSKQVINTGNTANDGTGDTLRAASIKINSNFTELYASAQSAFGKANAGYELANAAYAYANASAVLIGQELTSNVDFIAAINSTQNTTITSLSSVTTSAYDKANNVGSVANGAFGIANSATTTGTNAYNTANSAYNKANIAYTIANNALNVQTGGTISGDVTLGTNKLKFGSGDVYEYSDSILLNPNQNKSLTIKTSILDGFNEVVNGWTFGANGKLIFPDNTLQSTAFTTGISNTITATGVYANGAFSKANDAYSLTNSAFDKANTASNDQQLNTANSVQFAGITVPLLTNPNVAGSITIDPENTTLGYIKVDGYDDGGERVTISNQHVGSSGIYFYTEGGTFRMYQNQIMFSDSTWQSTAFQGVAVDQPARDQANGAFSVANTALPLANLKSIVASSTDFADFQTRIAAL